MSTLVNKSLLSISAVASVFFCNAGNQAIAQQITTTFECVQQGSGFATVAQRAERRTSPLITWNSTEFGLGFTPERRCQIVSQKLTDVVAQNSGLLAELNLTYGIVNDLTVICAVRGTSTGCSSDNMLFTLSRANSRNPQAILRSISTFSVEGSGSAIEESGSHLFLSLDEWADTAFESGTSGSQPAQDSLESPPRQGSTDMRI